MNKKLKPNSYAALDAENHFHPYSNARRIEEQGPMVISEGEGIYVWGDDGKLKQAVHSLLRSVSDTWPFSCNFLKRKNLWLQQEDKGGNNLDVEQHSHNANEATF